MENKNEKIKIGIDIDEVVAEFIESFLEYSNLKKGTSLKVKDINNYNLWETEIHGSKEESIREVMEFQNSLHFEKISVVENARETLEELQENFEIHFITSRPTKIKEKTINFLKENFPNNNFKVVFSGEIYGGKTKSEICKDEGIFAIIEDNLHYAFDCACGGVKAFLVDKPWNQNHKEHENLVKVNHLGEVLEHLREDVLKTNNKK